MTALHIAPGLTLPLDLVTQTVAVLAKRGAGKTYTASVLAEEMLKAGQQIVAVDPTGAWWGLRSEFPVVIFGGEHADVPLEESAGEVVARAVVESRVPAVLDLSLFRKGQMFRFMTAFAESLYRLNREAVHLFVDEADAVAPQARNYGGDENRLLGAMEDIVRRGRKRGIGCTLITQRPQVLNKNVLTQCEILIALRLVHPKDIDAIEEWVNVHGDPATAKQMIASLPSLPIGEAWVWAPGWGDLFQRVKVRKRETFDSGATPKPGETPRKPKKMAAVDLATLGEQIKATVEQAKANDPAALRKRVAELEKLLAERPAVEPRRVEVPALDAGQIADFRDMAKDVTESSSQLAREWSVLAVRLEAFTRQPDQRRPPAVATPAPARMVAAAKPKATGEQSPIGNSGKRRMLVALAQNQAGGLTHTKLSLLTGISQSGGTWRTYLGSLRGDGYVADAGDTLRITDAGLAALGDYTPLPTGPALLDFWRAKLGSGGKRRLFDVVVEAYPNELSHFEAARRCEIALDGGTWRTYLGELRGLELIVGKGSLRANPDLFS